MRGHRLQLVMIDPFSREIRSAGNPSLVIFALLPSFVKRSRGSTPGVKGILRSSISVEGSSPEGVISPHASEQQGVRYRHNNIRLHRYFCANG